MGTIEEIKDHLVATETGRCKMCYTLYKVMTIQRIIMLQTYSVISMHSTDKEGCHLMARDPGFYAHTLRYNPGYFCITPASLIHQH